ncbi:LacI family DNA-binding transcriptional regulator [Sulfoacidibacillus thermotolerans]|uniref:LacI family transcriptional regulator n=1 Tax=Sulfoacidibacillus thermotolerans TaxID=1765684 RepID=A0A2U3D779_SULT2|nr:LacI family DNA-binding transcriptional regulator [Sulfoacidibacillus thermotolerans]PWI57136.1 LacI family transcriptional regulator [Sulfoacidibacillus thermotolerans]
MPTIKDVARLAGVSVSTVSRVLNETGYVSADSRQRVLKVMEELHFTPNNVARGLVSRKTSSIGLLIPDVSNPFFSDVARGIEDAASALGLSVILCNSDWKIEREQSYIDILKGKWVEGIVVVGARSPEQRLQSVLSDLPFVLVDQKTSQQVNCVWIDNEKGGYIATKHLIERGCKRLIHVRGPINSPSATLRHQGFLRAIQEFGATGKIIQGNFRFESGYRCLEQILDDGLPDGIFAGNDMMALGIIQAAQTMGLKIPQDFLLIGFDDISFSSYISPTLTTIRQPGYLMGTAGVELLHQQIIYGQGNPQSREYQLELVVRNST